MIILVGLGNPEEEYAETRHNTGYRVIIELCKKLGFDFLKDAKPYRANLFLKTDVTEQEVVFSLPLGYMNNSGHALKQLMDFYGDNTTKDLWVIHDDTEIPFGEVRIKSGGTSGGHNGIKSIDETIGQNYWRVRVGVGRPAHADHDLADYVLAGFSAKEKEQLPAVIDQVTSYLIKSIEVGKLETAKFTTNAKKESNKSN